MKYTILFSTLLLAGCETFKMGAPWPKQNVEVIKACEPLKTFDQQQVSMAELIDLVQQNYQLYHLCKLNNDSWVRWYTTHWKETK
jgi:hypothetical protein